jgi:hypothetical protein
MDVGSVTQFVKDQSMTSPNLRTLLPEQPRGFAAKKPAPRGAGELLI